MNTPLPVTAVPKVKKGKLSLKREKKKAWDAFAQWYRHSATQDGYAICYTCDRRVEFDNIQPGHWMTGHTNTNYINEEYVRPQCTYCNVILKGNQGIFWERIEREIGTDKFLYLREHNKDFKNITIPDYVEIRETYKQKLSELV